MRLGQENVIWGCYQLTVTAGVALAECDTGQNVTFFS